MAHVEGWKQFCAELQIDPMVQVQFMIGWDNIQRTEASARELVFDAEEAARFVRSETVPVEGDNTLERGVSAFGGFLLVSTIVGTSAIGRSSRAW